MNDQPPEQREDDYFDTDKAVSSIGKMWRALGLQIAEIIPAAVIDGRPELALQWACYAEACFWKATGEGSSHDINDVIRFPPLKADEGQKP